MHDRTVQNQSEIDANDAMESKLNKIIRATTNNSGHSKENTNPQDGNHNDTLLEQLRQKDLATAKFHKTYKVNTYIHI